MKLLTVFFTFCVTGLSSGQAPFWNNNYPGPIYQQGSQFTQPGQASYNYQPSVPGVPINIQQLGTQTPFQQSNIQQPGQVPLNYQPGINGINIQQLTQSGSVQPALQPSNIQGIPIGSQQQIPFRSQQNGIPINTVQQGSYPVNQQFYQPQIGSAAPGPIKFPQ